MCVRCKITFHKYEIDACIKFLHVVVCVDVGTTLR